MREEPRINAAGDLLPPFVVFKGIRMNSVLKTNLDDAGVEANMTKSGFIDKQVFLKFLKFVNLNRLVQQETCYIVLEAHSSHQSYETFSYCLK